MKLSDFMAILPPGERADFAARAGTTVANLYQVAGGHYPPSADLVARIQAAAGMPFSDFQASITTGEKA